jgi:DNA modification methylase
MQKLNINPELQALIPPLNSEEYQQLTNNILAEGIREAILTWDGTIVDGHNRYAIANDLGIPFTTKAMQFTDLNECKEWMILNQFGRRNLQAFQRSVLALELEQVFRDKAKANQAVQYKGSSLPQKSEEVKPIETGKVLAKIANVSHDTIAKVKVLQAKATDDVKQQLRTGEVSINQAYKEIKKEEKVQQRQERMTEIKERIKELPIQEINIKNGDCLQILSELPDGCIDILITDPPYGISYHSNRSIYDDSITKRGLANDGRNEALKLLDDMCKLMVCKTSADAHLYIFTNWKMFTEFERIIGKYFDIKTPIIWDKGNKGSGDLDNDWGNQTEIIIYAVKGKKYVNMRRGNIVSVSRLHTSQMVHPTQKPDEVIKQLMEVSYQDGDFVVDPFMGSGSTIKVCNKLNAKCLGIELDTEMYKIANHYIYG